METSSSLLSQILINTNIPSKIAAGRQINAGVLPAIDSDALVTRCMGNMAFALSLLSELEDNGMVYVENIAQHVAAKECAAAADAAHSLKGAAGIIGAEPLRLLAAQIESAGNSNAMESITLLVEDLRQEMEKCLLQIPTIRSAPTRPSIK
ncbi:MAG TPA: Hpt domain-containing protein [Pirellula sp.]|nr:Hpt domain-containing protein [Pirellula sp.]